MFKYLPDPGGGTARCRFTILIVMAFMALTASSVLQAQVQEHGMSVTKGCNFNVRVCSDTPGPDDLDCQDEDQCLVPDCDESLPRDLICTFTATNADGFFDTLSIPVVSPVSGNSGAYDLVMGDVPAQIDWPSSDMSIIGVFGNASCAAGNTDLPCTVGPVIPGVIAAGAVQFEVIYTPTEADWDNTDGTVSNPLQDEAHVISFDLCDGPDSVDGVNCTTTIESDDDGSTASALVPGCLPPDPVICPPDDDACTEDFVCDSTTGECPPPGDRTVCPPDDDACTEDFVCDSITGECPPPGDPTFCPPDDDACTEDFVCDSLTGECPPPGDPTFCPPDDDACTEDFVCDSLTGECPPPGDPTVCPPDDDACTEDFVCDSLTGECPPPGDPTVCPPDDDACTEDYECDSLTGECPPPSDPRVCPPRDDGVICDLCNPETGECIPEVPVPNRCIAGEERCRTPGFWGARGGIEKAPKSQNITQAVIDKAILENGFGLPVCGIYIDNTELLSNFSAIEAMCVSVKGVTQRQLVRQLTAAALNCVLGDCNPEHTAMLASCNAVCDTGVGDAGACIDELDCFNNGGDWDGSMCITGAGYCEIGGEACDDVNTCVGLGDSCLPGDTCHDRDLCPDFDDDGDINDSDFCFEPPGPASSPRKCNAASKNDTYVP